MATLIKEHTSIGYSETITTVDTDVFPEGFDPSSMNGNNMSPEMMSALELAQEQAKLGDQTIYANLDDDGYVLSVYQVPAGAPEGTPWVESLEPYNLDGYRINAHKYNPETHTLEWDQEHYDEIIAGLKQDREDSAKAAEIDRLNNEYTSSKETVNVDIDELLTGIDLDV